MERRGNRVLVAGVEVDVPWGAFSDGQLVAYDAAAGGSFKGVPGIPVGIVAGDVIEWNGTAWDPKFHATGFNTATQSPSATALADVTGHTFALPRAGTYAFRFTGAYLTNLTTTGLRFSAAFSGTSSSYNGALRVVTGVAGDQEYFAQTALDTAMGSGTGPGGANVGFEFWGRIVATSSGTFAFRIASEVAANNVTLAIGAVSVITQL